jgi:hypothetical protein
MYVCTVLRSDRLQEVEQVALSRTKRHSWMYVTPCVHATHGSHSLNCRLREAKKMPLIIWSKVLII